MPLLSWLLEVQVLVEQWLKTRTIFLNLLVGPYGVRGSTWSSVCLINCFIGFITPEGDFLIDYRRKKYRQKNLQQIFIFQQFGNDGNIFKDLIIWREFLQKTHSLDRNHEAQEAITILRETSLAEHWKDVCPRPVFLKLLFLRNILKQKASRESH